MRTFAPAILLLALLVSMTSGPSRADTLSDGYITGQVVTSRGEPLAGVTVVVRNPETGSSSSTESDERGYFRLSLLQPGQYHFIASLGGFADESFDVVVRVGSGTNVTAAMRSNSDSNTMEEIEVVASSVSGIDMQSAESVLILDEVKLDILPIARDTTAILLMTPGSVPGSEGFDNGDVSEQFASLGGSAIGENAYYVNGMNITNFRTGLRSSTVPFEFLQQVQVKYGGISAEYGRATGGFVNAVTKRGTNEFSYGVGIYHTPEDWTETAPDVFSSDGRPTNIGSYEGRTISEAYVYASGPIVRDKLFFYGIYNPRDTLDHHAGPSTYWKTESDDAFWGLKLDYQITDNHVLEFTAFSDEADDVEINYEFDSSDLTVGDEVGEVVYSNGGLNWILKYSGNLSQDFSVSALVGYSEYDRSSSGEGDQYPVILDYRAPAFALPLGSWVSVFQSEDYDERELARLDFEWDLGRHLLRAGVDHESNTTYSVGRYSGDAAYLYYDAVPGEQLPTGIVPPGATQVALHYFSENGGSYDIETTSWYLEDEWRVHDDVKLSIGIRNEVFENSNANGEPFIKMTDQWAPRISAVWDMFGDGRAKLYGSYGRFYLPVFSSINATLAGGNTFTEDWWVLEGLNADDTPILGEQIGPTLVFNDGEVPDPASVVDQSIEPMYQDEYTLGFEMELGENFITGISVIHRDLASTIEDTSGFLPLIQYAADNGYTDYQPPFLGPYILTNPGSDLNIRIDMDGDGVPEDIHFTSEELGIPVAERKYNAMNLFVERVWEGDWFFRADYTWSKSYGNIEGTQTSDFGSVVPGFSSNFDFPGLMEHSSGDLPNDRRHSMRIYGSWQFTRGWSVSGNASYTTGRPKNVFSLHPTDPISNFYGSSAYYTPDGDPSPRGSHGELPSVKNIDLALMYETDVFRSGRLTLQLDVFNVFNWDTETRIDETTQHPNGDLDTRFGLAYSFQQPRSVRISARLDF